MGPKLGCLSAPGKLVDIPSGLQQEAPRVPGASLSRGRAFGLPATSPLSQTQRPASYPHSGPPAYHSPPHQSHPRSCWCRRTGAQSTGRLGHSCNGRAGLEGTQTGLRQRARISLGRWPKLQHLREQRSPAPPPPGAPPARARHAPSRSPFPEPRPGPTPASPHSSGFSSELSPQSSSPSHFHARGLHRVLLHWNSSRGQVRTGRQVGVKEESEAWAPGCWGQHLA